MYRAVREALASGEVSVPRALGTEVQRYQECGQLRCGFVEVRCEACHEVEVVAFSCKGRGLCPSCTTRRSVETAAHLVGWLPAVGYRQWTLSLPVKLRWVVLRTRGLLGVVERALVRAVFRWQRGCARYQPVEVIARRESTDRSRGGRSRKCRWDAESRSRIRCWCPRSAGPVTSSTTG